MRLFEIHNLSESITFGVSELDMNDPEYPKGIFSGQKWETPAEEECWVCDGEGHQLHGDFTDEQGKHVPPHPVECGMCKGKKFVKTFKSSAPELNVANSNAQALLDYLGLDNSDSCGHIDPKDLPALRRKLIKLKNSDDIDDLVDPGSDTRGPMRRGRDEDGNTTIGRGPRVINGGRTYDQVIRYVDRMLAIIAFAQEHNAHVTWG